MRVIEIKQKNQFYQNTSGSAPDRNSTPIGGRHTYYSPTRNYARNTPTSAQNSFSSMSAPERTSASTGGRSSSSIRGTRHTPLKPTTFRNPVRSPTTETNTSSTEEPSNTPGNYLESLKVDELKEICRQLNIKVGGIKVELIRRIKKARYG